MVDFTVILAVRDGMPFIKEAVRSVLDQEGPSLELLLINDGSTDGTKTWVDELSGRDQRVHVFHNERSLGLTCCLNQGLRQASGKYIARIDHDDFWLEGKLLKQFNLLEQDDQLVLVGTDYYEKDMANQWQRESQLYPARNDEEIRQSLFKFNPFFHSSVVFARWALERVGGYDESYRYAQDYEMWTRLMTIGKGCIMPEVLCVRRIGQENISVSKERAQRYYALRARLIWCSRHKISWSVVIPVFRDILIILLPQFIKNVVRQWLFRKPAR